MKRIITGLCILLSCAVQAQKLYTKNGHAAFFSKASLENITAETNQVATVLNTRSGEIQFSILVKSFHFRKALMEEHFNENYMESDKYPKATFKGSITDMSKVNFTADGSYAVTVAGELSIHGVTNKISVPGTITVAAGIPRAAASFNILLSDYKISIPALVKDNISSSIAISVNCTYNQQL
ncbi:MAG: YceI family protein [Ferruginibacter sp.]